MSGDSRGGGEHRLPGGPDGPDWMGTLYGEQRGRLYGYLWGQTGSREDALDLLQDVFTRAVRHRDTLEAMPVERRAYWLFAAARRLCIDRHRRGAAAARLRDRLERAARSTQSTKSHDDAVEEADAWRRVNAAIAELPSTLREVLAMTVLGEMDSGEIGAILGIAPATARYRLMRARRALRDRLGIPHAMRSREEAARNA